MQDSQVSLWHVSETPDIALFRPRIPPSLDAGVHAPVVWAVDAQRLANYLLPRDCPRVTYYALPTSTQEDLQYFFAGTVRRQIVTIESAWMERVRTTPLYLYRFPVETFRLINDVAGYWVSEQAVAPIEIEYAPSALQRLLCEQIELRDVANLWSLLEKVAVSSLAFSCIRMRNAQGKPL